jgi:hypothetical protein
MTFLPNDYTPPKKEGGYKKLEEGDNKVRILGDAVVGYEYWTTENQPVRSKLYPETTPNIKTDQNGKTRINEFFAFLVWDYEDSKIKIMEITQPSIKESLYNLHIDEAWGHPRNYDLNIKRTGKSFNDTKYDVVPKPPAELTAEIGKALEECKIDLEKLFTGENPFEATEPEYPQEIRPEEIPL